MAWAFRQQIPNPGAKLVLLALCDFADETWSCFPGQATLADKTSQGERTVRRHLDWLERAGYIVSRPRFASGRRTSNRYTIHAPQARIALPAASDPLDVEAGEPASRDSKQEAGMAAGQSDHRPDSVGQAASLAGEPLENHQGDTPQPPVGSGDLSAGDGEGGCAAHPNEPVANCRACGTSPRARRLAAAAEEKNERDQRARDRDRQWFENERARRARVAELEAQGALEVPRQAARAAIHRSSNRHSDINDT